MIGAAGLGQGGWGKGRRGGDCWSKLDLPFNDGDFDTTLLMLRTALFDHGPQIRNSGEGAAPALSDTKHNSNPRKHTTSCMRR